MARLQRKKRPTTRSTSRRSDIDRTTSRKTKEQGGRSRAAKASPHNTLEAKYRQCSAEALVLTAEDLDLTVEQFSRRIHRSIGTIRNWMNGAGKFDIAALGNDPKIHRHFKACYGKLTHCLERGRG